METLTLEHQAFVEQYRARLVRMHVDGNQAMSFLGHCREIPMRYRTATAAWASLGYLLLIAGFVALIWFPWWVPLVGIGGLLLIHSGNKESAMGFIKEAALEDASAYRAALVAGVLTVTAMEQ